MGDFIDKTDQTMRATLDTMDLASLVVLAGSGGHFDHLFHDHGIDGLLIGKTSTDVETPPVFVQKVLDSKIQHKSY